MATLKSNIVNVHVIHQPQVTKWNLTMGKIKLCEYTHVINLQTHSKLLIKNLPVEENQPLRLWNASVGTIATYHFVNTN